MSEVKPGVKTSEFWLVIFGLVASAFPTVLAILGDRPWVAVGTATAGAVLGAVYIAGRTLLKREQARETNVIPDAWEPAIDKALDIIESLAQAMVPRPGETPVPPAEEDPR